MFIHFLYYDIINFNLETIRKANADLGNIDLGTIFTNTNLKIRAAKQSIMQLRYLVLQNL